MAISLQGQDIFGLSEKVSSDINVLRLTATDTIIRFSLPDFSDIGTDSLPGIGNVLITGEEYIIYKKGDNYFSQKFVSHSIPKTDRDTISASLPLLIDASKIFRLLHSSLSYIRHEELKPYIYSQFDNNSKQKTYDILQVLHFNPYSISVFAKDSAFTKVVNKLWFNDKYHNFPPNLNFSFNSKTKTKTLFDELEKLVDALDKKYRFI